MNGAEFLEWLETAKIPDRHKMAAQMRARGATLAAIAKALDVGPDRAGEIVRKVKRIFDGRHEAEERRLRLEELRREAEAQKNERKKDWRSLTADDLELSVRAANVLRSMSWPEPGTLGHIADMTDAQLLRVPNCGRKTIREFREVQMQFAPESGWTPNNKIDRERKRESGFVPLEVWVKPEHVESVRHYVERLLVIQKHGA